MKINDLITESKYTGYQGRIKDFGRVKQSVDPAIPNGRIVPQVRNTDTYMQYRYGVALAAAAAQQGEEFQQESAWSENISMVGYTDAEIEIMDAADKLMGVSGVALTGKSSEKSDVNSSSPVADTSWRKK